MIERISHYRIVLRIGRGAMGEVYHAIDERLGRPVALKLLPASISGSADSQSRLLREAQAASALNHPGIVIVHDIGAWEGRVFMVMELVEGGRFTDAARSGIALAEALALVAEVADALGAAHARSIFHRDIKSDNLMRTREGRAKVLDFGLAKLRDSVAASEDTRIRTGQSPRVDDTDAHALTLAPSPGVPLVDDPAGVHTPIAEQLESSERARTPITASSSSPSETIAGSVLGTPAYMSPEQATGQSIDATSEVFSLGVVLYELVTGVLPFVGDSIDTTIQAILTAPIVPPSRRAPARKIPPFVDMLVLRAIERERERRFPDMPAFAAALRAARQRLLGRRSRAAIGAGIAAVLALGICGALLVGHRHPAAAPKLTAIKRITFDSGCEENPSFSRDGGKIVYDGLIDGDYEVFSLDLQSGARTRLTTAPGWDYAAQLAPDGHSIAWLHSGDDGPQLLVADSLQAEPRVIGPMDAITSWTNDGGLLAIFDRRHLLHVSPVGGERTLVGEFPAAVETIQFGAFRDGSILALWHDSSASNAIGIFERGGKLRRVVEGLRPGTAGVEVAPSQHAFYYTRAGGNARELIRHSLDDDSEVAVPGGSTPVTFAIAPDGKRLVYSTCLASQRIVHIEPDGRTADVMGMAATRDVGPRVVDRDRLVFSSDRAGPIQVWIHDARTNEYRALTGKDADRPAVSHDKKLLAYVDGAQGGIFVAPLDGGAPRRVTDDPSDTSPSFSHDDRALVFARGTKGARIWAVSIDGQGAHPISPGSGYAPATSPTSDLVLYVRKEDSTQLFTTTVSGAAATLAPLHLGSGSFEETVVSPDGKRVALLRNMQEVVELALVPGAEPLRKWRTLVEGVVSLAYDVDGHSFIVSLTSWEGDLWLADGELP